MKCLLVSFFNSSNIGDCLIADTLYNMASKEFETKKYSYTGNPAIITDMNNISGTNIPENVSFKGKVYKKLKEGKLTFPIFLYKKLKSSNQVKESFEDNIRNTDLLVIGGGNMIFDKDKFSNSGERFNEFVSMAKKFEKKVFAISLGIGPFQTLNQEKSAVMALKKCDYITFRDQKSYDIYVKHVSEVGNVQLTVDPVFSMPNIIKPKAASTATIGLNIFNNKLIDDSEEDYMELIRSYTKLASNLVETLGVKVVLFSTDLKDYSAVKDVMYKFQNNENIKMVYINGYDSLINLYENITLLIGARMHSMIIAYTQLIPVIGLSWQDKVEAFFEIIDSTDSVYRYNNLNENIEAIIYSCKDIIENLEQEKKEISKQLEIIVERGNIDKEILNNLNEKLLDAK